MIGNKYKKYYPVIKKDKEVFEFLIEKNGEVLPIEVKAGNTATPSLNSFINEFKPSIAYKLIDGNQGLVGSKRTIPHYMILFI